METIQLTATAIAAAKRLASTEPEWAGKPLRLYLSGKGCDGFYYGVSFNEAQDDDMRFDCDGVELVCDRETYIFCQGSEIDWVDDERGQGFLVENPNHKKYRGKFFRRKKFKEQWEQIHGSNQPAE